MTTFTCNKKKYASLKHAQFDAKQLRRKYHEPEEAYYCKKCQCRHVGARYVGKIKREEQHQERHR